MTTVMKARRVVRAYPAILLWLLAALSYFVAIYVYGCFNT